ncbi:MAG: ABC transporter permease [Acidimicrobiia bacterium]|nr:ABC transporter permease [Acidimicrobiia bacterium]
MTDTRDHEDGVVDATTAQFADDAEGMSVEPVTQWHLFWTRFRRHRMAMISAIVLLIIVLSAVFADVLPIKDPYSEFVDSTGRVLSNVSPRTDHIMGTDTLGRDILARVIFGGRTSLIVAGVTGLLVAGLGTVVGAIAGYYGGIIDQALMRFTDLVLSLPLLPVAIVAARVFGGSLYTLALLLGFLLWGTLARIVRAEFLSLREKEFVEAARAAGAKDRRIIFRHVLPNAMSPIIVQSTLIVGTAIILEAALSFLGFGVRPPTPAWGQMANDGAQLAANGFWWLVVYPGLALIITVLSVNFLGDGLRDALDPTQTIERR